MKNVNTQMYSGLLAMQDVCMLNICEERNSLRPVCRLPQELGGSSPTVFSVNSLQELTDVRIASDNHCFGCTAGSGSSCQGSTS